MRHWGAAAWGGATTRPLPATLRVACAIWALAAVIVLRRAGFHVVALPAGLTWWGTWTLVGVLALGAVMNFASASPWERYGGGPFTLVLAGLCLVVARMPATAPP